MHRLYCIIYNYVNVDRTYRYICLSISVCVSVYMYRWIKGVCIIYIYKRGCIIHTHICTNEDSSKVIIGVILFSFLLFRIPLLKLAY